MSPNLFILPDWEEYEDLVCDAIRHENPEINVERNIHVRGHLSEHLRQIDIALRGKFAGHNIFAIVDCKKYSRKLDVNDVGEFATTLNDVNADFGILVTQKGFSDAAIKMAKKNRIKLEIKTLEDLYEYRIVPEDYCEECDPGDDNRPGIIDWSGFENVEGDTDKVRDIGTCDWCGTMQLQCGKCGCITPYPEYYYDKQVECLGGCGTIFSVKREYAGDGMFDYILSVELPD
jgi:hypothetical protein